MAGASTPFQCLQGEVTCSMCLEYYKNPVTVGCGHSFCRDCILSHWMGDSMFCCPQCGKKSQVLSLRTNIQLENVTEIAKQMQLQQNKMVLCDLHGAGLTLFCKEDQTLICVICKAKDHKTHIVIPVEEAAQECKVQFQKVQDLLKKDMENFSAWEFSQNRSISQLKDKIKEMEELIQHCFRKAHQFLNEEEKLLLRRLEHRQDELLYKLEEKLDEISTQKSSVQELIREIEANTQKPAPDLLKDTKSILTRRNNLRIQEPEDVPCELQLDYCLPGILEMLRKYAVNITLDPDTAHFDLIISEDGKSVKNENGREFKLELWELPNNPERFCYDVVVLGTGRFVSGRHYWEIEHEVFNSWYVGVCLDSVSREEHVEPCSDLGFWTIETELEDYQEQLQGRTRIGIFLDYEAGEVTFYSVNKRIAIQTFSDTFSGTLRPFFRAIITNLDSELTLCSMFSPV